MLCSYTSIVAMVQLLFSLDAVKNTSGAMAVEVETTIKTWFNNARDQVGGRTRRMRKLKK